MSATQNDIVLWQNFRGGNKQSLATLFEKHYPNLKQYGYKICGEEEVVKDNIQQLFLDIWLQKNPPLVGSVQAYLIKALKYKLLKVIAYKQKNRLIETHPDDAFEISRESFIIKNEEDNLKIRTLIKAFTKLPPKQREIVYLKYYLNLSYEDVCDVMNIQYQVARNQLSQAIKTIKQLVAANSFILIVTVLNCFS